MMNKLSKVINCIVISLLGVLIFNTPFNISAYEILNLGYFDCVNFFKYRNLSYVGTNAINLELIEEGYNINVPRHNINTQNNYDDKYIARVYNFNGEFLGNFVNYMIKNTASGTNYQEQYIRYLKSDGTFQTCNTASNSSSTKCYIVYEHPTNNKNYYEAAYVETVQSHNSVISGTLGNGDIISFMSGTYTSFNSFQSGKGNHINEGEVLHLIFMIPSSQLNQNITTFTNNISYYVNTNGLELNFSGDAKLNGGYRIYDINISSNISGYFWLDLNSLNNKSVDIFPIYFGYVRNMSRDIYTSLYGDNYAMWLDSINIAVSSGNTETDDSINNNQNAINNFQNESDNYNNITTNITNDFNNNLNSIDTNFDLSNNVNFISSANWVKTQFNRLSNYTPVKILLTFCLIMSLALLLIGVIRR